MHPERKVMRILHATNSAEIATPGIEKQVATLAVAQKARGSDVMIAIDRPGIFIESCREHGVSVVVRDQLQNPFGRLSAMTPEEAAAAEDAVQELIGCVKSFSPDIIHCHSPAAALVAIAAGNRINVPCTLTGDDPRTIIGGWRRGLRFATLCLTAVNFEQLLKSEIPDADIYYVPIGTRAVPAGQADEPGDGHSPSLIAVGLLDPRKGFDVLILAMVELRRRLGPACPVLNIYGDGSSREYLTEMTGVLRLDDIVRFHGFKAGVLEKCPRSDILVMTSRHEVGPLVVLEAISRGMPIVATDVGEVARMLPDRRYGRVVPKDSVMPLAEAIESLLADIAGGRFDPDLLIERHRSFYSAEKFAERTEAAYNQILLNSLATAQRAG
jgi:glycosyltransferase involved in cell wall biosynthesis